jgi:hypothetical protein
MGLLGDDEVLTGLGMRAVEDGAGLRERVLREPVQLEVLARLDVRPALRDLVGRDPRRREELHQVGPGQPLQRPRVGHLVDAAAHEQVARERSRGRVLDHLVHLELVVPRSRLEEEVVRQILDQVAGREHVVAVPGPALRVLRQRALSAGDEVWGLPMPLTLASAASGARPSSIGLAPVSIVFTVVQTSSTCPNSSAPMLHRRS